MKLALLKWIGWFFLCAALQSALVPYLAIAGVKPDLIMLVFFLYVIKGGVMHGIYAGFIIGLGFDLFSPGLLGQNALAMTITGFVCGHFNERILRLDAAMRAVLLLGAFVLNDSILIIVHIVISEGSVGALFYELLVTTLPRALYTQIFVVIPFVWGNVVRPARLVD